MAEEIYVKISDVADILVGKNINKDKLNADGKGLPYIVGASSLQDSVLECKGHCESIEGQIISKTGDVIISTVGTLGKMAINNIGDCVLSKHVCAVRFASQIVPEYGLLCIKASIAAVITEANDSLGENVTGFSRKLDVGAIGDLPFCLISIRRQEETVERMVEIMRQLDMKNIPEVEMPEFENIEDIQAYLKFEQTRVAEHHQKVLGLIGDISKALEIPPTVPTYTPPAWEPPQKIRRGVEQLELDFGGTL